MKEILWYHNIIKFPRKSVHSIWYRKWHTETYSTNHLYDDLTSDFNGKNRQYALTVDKAQKTGIATNNALILINGILQAPGSNGDFTNNCGIRNNNNIYQCCKFCSKDVNTASIPVGGVIISVASLVVGYQPLVLDGGTAVVSLAGTINSVSIVIQVLVID